MTSTSDRTWFDRFRTRRNRRSLAVFYAANLAAMLLASWLVDSYWVIVPFAVLWVASMIMVTKSTRGITAEGDRSLDEQQIAFRNAGFKASYWIGVAVAFAGGLIVASISDSDTAFEVGLFLGVWGFVSGLPAMVVAWTLPPEVDDEE
jgi:predicted MFS family arabinose efflux permease